MIDHSMTKFQSDLFGAGFWELSDEMRDGVYAAMLDTVRVLATAKRGKHADEKWKRITIEDHMRRARDHASSAYMSSGTDEKAACGTWFDDDGLPHAAHAVARICCAYGRELIVNATKTQP